MARAKIEQSVFRESGSVMRPGVGCSAQVNLRDGAAATIYSTATGGAALANPLTVDSTGRIQEAWLDLGSYDIQVTGEGLDDYTIRFEAVSGAGGGGRELGYAEILETFSTTSVDADVPGLTVTVDVEDRPIKVIFDAQFVLNTSTTYAIANIKESSTTLAVGTAKMATSNQAIPMHREVRLTPEPGQHTYKVSFGSSIFGSGTSLISASAISPAFLQVIEV